MRYIDEYRSAVAVQKIARELRSLTTRNWTIMEICGGQTHAILRFGIDRLLPESISLIHGPGCPVCVTPVELIDKAIEIASEPRVIFCSFGDMLRVPGSSTDLLSAKARGADVRMVYSPLDALRLAEKNPGRDVVFFAVGFETTAPTTAMAVIQAAQRGVRNFSLLVAHVRVPPAVELILSAPDRRVRGLLAAGHVCTVMGWTEYEPIAEKYGVPIVVTGFEPLDIMHGLLLCVQQLEQGRAQLVNQYSRVVCREGNRHAQELIQCVFRFVPRNWRGIGTIPDGGLGLRESYGAFDAENRFGPARTIGVAQTECMSGLVLQGRIKPSECPAFGGRCTPEHPLGATMVSSEGACAAYYKYRKTTLPHPDLLD